MQRTLSQTFLNRCNEAYVQAARKKFIAQAPPQFHVMPPPLLADLTSDFYSPAEQKGLITNQTKQQPREKRLIIDNPR